MAEGKPADLLRVVGGTAKIRIANPEDALKLTEEEFISAVKDRLKEQATRSKNLLSKLKSEWNELQSKLTFTAQNLSDVTGLITATKKELNNLQTRFDQAQTAAQQKELQYKKQATEQLEKRLAEQRDTLVAQHTSLRKQLHALVNRFL